MNQILRLDYETYSELDIRKVGAHRYAHDDSTYPLLFSFAFDDDDVGLVDFARGEVMPKDVTQYILKSKGGLQAQNSFFDRHVMNANGLRTEITRWTDTMVKGYSLGLPGRLEALGVAVGLPLDMQKMSDGKKLINRFCKPAPANHNADRYTEETHPEEWERFRVYSKFDIVSMREVDKRLPDWNYRGQLLDQWHLDQEINDRGMYIDVSYARKAMELCDETILELNGRLQDLTMGELQKHSALAQMQEYLKKKFRIKLPNMQAGTLDRIVEQNIPDHAREIINIRRSAGKSSTAKYAKLGACTSEDHRLHGGLQFAGAARTLRWAGRLFQPQNLPRPVYGLDQAVAAKAIQDEVVPLLYDDPMSIASSCVRGCVSAPKGKLLVSSDLASIEGRVVAWAAGEEWKLQAFREYDAGTGPDMYKLTYANSFKINVDEVTDELRQIGKVEELSLGYQGWINAFHSMAESYGVELEDDVIKEIILGWRRAHPHIVELWAAMQLAFISAIESPRTDIAFKAGPHLSIKKVGDYVLVRLPNGRFIPYFKPKIVWNFNKWTKRTEKGIQFKGVDEKSGNWIEIDTYGGKLVENATQAMARDILAENLTCINEQYPVVLTVHDEIIAEVAEGFAERALQKINGMLAEVPTWCPDLPLAAEGFITKRYRKG